jgi:hypothetical protein
MRTTIDVDDELLRRAKVKAAQDGRTLTSLIEEGLRVMLAGRPKAARAAIDLPVSSAKGGLHPGYDWASLVRDEQAEADAAMLARAASKRS